MYARLLFLFSLNADPLHQTLRKAEHRRMHLASGLSEPSLDARNRLERGACENFSDKRKSIRFITNHQLAGVTGFTQFPH
jgi:hypothetical protein